MPNRILYDSLKRSEQIDALSWFDEVVFYRLLVTVDDYGCTDGRISALRSDLFPLKENITRNALVAAIDHLERTGLIVKYEVKGIPYIFLPGFSNRQRIRNKRNKYPLPPDIASTKPPDAESLYSDEDAAEEDECEEPDGYADDADTDDSALLQQSATTCGHLSAGCSKLQTLVSKSPQVADTCQQVAVNCPPESESESISESEYKEYGAHKAPRAASRSAASAPSAKRFVKPTVEELRAYCAERGNGLDAERIFDHYESNGWRVGKTPMKDWKAAVRNWERKNQEYTQSASKTPCQTKKAHSLPPKDNLDDIFG